MQRHEHWSVCLVFSYEHWLRKIAWARALFHRASRICDTDSLFQKKNCKIKLSCPGMVFLNL